MDVFSFSAGVSFVDDTVVEPHFSENIGVGHRLLLPLL